MTEVETLPPLAYLFKGITGSTAYGLNHADSDLDRKGIFLHPNRLLYGLDTPVDTYTQHEPDFEVHEISKYLRLTLACNPNLLELLFLPSDCVEFQTAAWRELISNRDRFLSEKAVRDSYGGYAKQQIERARRKYASLQEVFGVEVVERVRREQVEARGTGDGLSPMSGGATQGGATSTSRRLSTEATGPGAAARGASDADVRDHTGGLRPDGREGSLGVSDLLDSTRGGGGSLSRDGSGSRGDLSEVQSGDGALRGFTGDAGERGQLSKDYAGLSKHLRHCFRLFWQGAQLLETGEMNVRLDAEQRRFLFELGDSPIEEIVAEFERQDHMFKATVSGLPEKPDRDWVNEWLIDLRRGRVSLKVL